MGSVPPSATAPASRDPDPLAQLNAAQRAAVEHGTEAAADLEATRTERMQALRDVEAARLLLSEAADPKIAALPDVEAGLLAATQVQVRLQLAEHRAALAGLRSEIAEKNSELTQLDTQLAAAQASVRAL